jgi:hypothetical protein
MGKDCSRAKGEMVEAEELILNTTWVDIRPKGVNTWVEWLPKRGREQLVEKIGEWGRLTRAMGLILEPGNGLQAEEA